MQSVWDKTVFIGEFGGPFGNCRWATARKATTPDVSGKPDSVTRHVFYLQYLSNPFATGRITVGLRGDRTDRLLSERGYPENGTPFRFA